MPSPPAQGYNPGGPGTTDSSLSLPPASFQLLPVASGKLRGEASGADGWQCTCTEEGLFHHREDRDQFVSEGREMVVGVSHTVLFLQFFFLFVCFLRIISPRQVLCIFHLTSMLCLPLGGWPAPPSWGHEPVSPSVRGRSLIPIIRSSQWKNHAQS